MIEDELQVIIKDANDNYNNGRFHDARQHYENIVRQLFGDENIKEALYYSYRTLLCIDENDLAAYTRECILLGTYLVKFGVFRTSKLIEDTINPRKKLSLLQLQEKLIDDLSLEHLRDRINVNQRQNIRTILQEHDLSEEERVQFLERLSELEPDNKEVQQKLFVHYKKTALGVVADEITVYKKIDLFRKALNFCSLQSEKEEIINEINELTNTFDI